ncbi:MAG: M20/M25/M40 family metallo-hydrolase [Balneolales bacterium]
MKPIVNLLLFFTLSAGLALAQGRDQVIDDIIGEATENSHLEKLAHELLDVIGPRLVGTPQMQQAHDWAVATYEGWGISARNEQWGEWRGWQRGITHVDMISPRVVSLEGMMLAWSPGTSGRSITGGVVVIPDMKNAEAFQEWLPRAEGKFVLVSVNRITGRPDTNWEEYATEESLEKMETERTANARQWQNRIFRTGYNPVSLQAALEEAGAAGIITSNWSGGFGVNKVFGARTREIPTIDLALEDYGMLYRMAENGVQPEIRVTAESRELGTVPVFNTIAEIRGSETPEEYVILSAHFDSWDGATGATDNGTGTITMMEVMRILEEVYPSPKRTILAGHWGSEEQGLNGSRAFVEDHPGIAGNLQALFNQDNGTGRVVSISGQGFVNAYEYWDRWLAAVPESITRHIETDFPGMPDSGGTDHASFVAVGAPAFSLRSLSWAYRHYTWHTNRDTYDKIVFDDVRSNAILIAILTYMASEEAEQTSREKRVMPVDTRTGNPARWPVPRPPERSGGQH